MEDQTRTRSHHTAQNGLVLAALLIGLAYKLGQHKAHLQDTAALRQERNRHLAMQAAKDREIAALRADREAQRQQLLERLEGFSLQEIADAARQELQEGRPE